MAPNYRQEYLRREGRRRVALISVPVSNDGEGAPGPSLLGTGDDVQRMRKGRDTARTNTLPNVKR